MGSLTELVFKMVKERWNFGNSPDVDENLYYLIFTYNKLDGEICIILTSFVINL